MPNDECLRCSGPSLSPPGSISIARDTSRYIRPTRSKTASILPSSKVEESFKIFAAIDKVLLKMALLWKVARRNLSWLFQEAQGGKLVGIGEGLG